MTVCHLTLLILFLTVFQIFLESSFIVLFVFDSYESNSNIFTALVRQMKNIKSKLMTTAPTARLLPCTGISPDPNL